MIFDKLDNIQRYGFDFQFILDDLNNNEFQKGRFEIEEDNKFGIGLSYSTVDENAGLWEAHRKYLDIHVILQGEEIIHLNDISEMESTQDYEEDYELFKGKGKHSIHLKEGYFLLLFPNEVHKTSIQVGSSNEVKKKVYKLRF
ncbi:YhcH/YjgK/YiaL family protein [Sphingobacterium sp. NGMCC 1.201703]|uniref:YhcH/YjgK/YiaL family protein n=1 Tax=Sphingobacterium sp. NGMCC 1.201703 TaxID=3388657 RepID=UPI0039FD7C81